MGHLIANFYFLAQSFLLSFFFLGDSGSQKLLFGQFFVSLSLDLLVGHLFGLEDVLDLFFLSVSLPLKTQPRFHVLLVDPIKQGLTLPLLLGFI